MVKSQMNLFDDKNEDKSVLNHIAIKHDLLEHIDADWVHGVS